MTAAWYKSLTMLFLSILQCGIRLLHFELFCVFLGLNFYGLTAVTLVASFEVSLFMNW